MGFKRMAKMETTEPSVDEAGKGMKKGGKAKMADGGMPMGAAPAGALPAVAAQVGRRRPVSAAEMAAARPRGASLMRSPAMGRPAPSIPAQAMGRVKNGGAIESKAMHAKEERELKGIKKDLMSHESKPASKAHKGLKTGGVINGQGGYKTGGVIKKFAAGGAVSGYKEGGHCAMKNGGEAGFKTVKKGGCW
jgi:hypothetical protein